MMPRRASRKTALAPAVDVLELIRRIDGVARGAAVLGASDGAAWREASESAFFGAALVVCAAGLVGACLCAILLENAYDLGAAAGVLSLAVGLQLSLFSHLHSHPSALGHVSRSRGRSTSHTRRYFVCRCTTRAC